jgi:hypothetical protein
LNVFWDTSSILPLVLREQRQEDTLSIWESSRNHFAWSWLKVEAEAACVRQKATPDQWMELRSFTDYMGYADILPSEMDALLHFNRVIGLRSADAAHLFCFSKLIDSVRGLFLASFDQEMLSVAQRLGYPIHPHCLKA